jgi:hypothetical protein
MSDGDLGQSDGSVGRREILKRLGVVGTVSLSVFLGISHGDIENASVGGRGPESGGTTGTDAPDTVVGTPLGPGPTDVTPSGPGTPVETTVPEPQFDSVNVNDFGAAVDDRTDDSEALRTALDAVNPGGTVVLPPGEIRLSAMNKGTDSHQLPSAAVPIERPDDGLTIQGAGPGPLGTRLVMDGGHKMNHTGFSIDWDTPDSPENEYSGLTVRNLILDGNLSNQDPAGGRYPNGFGVNIRGQSRGVVFENCLFKDWASVGGLMQAPGIRVRNCTFLRNGYGLLQDGNHGHGFNVNTGGLDGRVVARNCLFAYNSGQGVDARQGKVTVKNSVFKGNGWGVKIKQKTEDVLLERCRMENSGHMHVHCVPTGDDGTGSLRLQTVLMDDSTWPAIALNQRPGSLLGDEIVIKNADTEEHKSSAIFINADSPVGDRTVDIGTLSVHDVVGTALDCSHAYGTIDTLIHSGTEGVGPRSDISIGTVKTGEPIDVSVPTESTVGAVPISNIVRPRL